MTGGFANNSGIPLKLVNGQSYNLLVNQTSIQNPDFRLVSPGNSSSSLLFLKITQDPPPVGHKMPLDGKTPPTPEQIELIRQWIDDGARNN